MDQNLNVLVILIPNMTGASWMEEATQIQIIESYDEIIQQIIDFGNISVILLKSKQPKVLQDIVDHSAKLNLTQLMDSEIMPYIEDKTNEL